MTAGRRQRRIERMGLALAAGVMMIVCGPAMGQSYWAGRAQDVAAARLAAQTGAAANAGQTPAAPTKTDKMPAPSKNRGFKLPAFRLASASPATPAGETGTGKAGQTQEPPAESVMDKTVTRESVMQEPTTREAVSEGTAKEIRRGPLPGFFETVKRDLLEAPGVLWHDTKATYGNPWNLAFLAGAGGTAIALRPEADDDIEDFYDKHHTFPRGERDTFDVIGNPGISFAVAGVMYVAGQTMQECKTYEVGKRAFSALIITDLSTLLLKVSAGTEAPNGRRFAFPSGHVSSTMALATVLNDAYGPIVGVPMYGITVFSGIQRLDAREHDFSDVIFGAALGWVVAESVMKEHRPEIFGGELVPYCDPNRAAAGVAWIKPLGCN